MSRMLIALVTVAAAVWAVESESLGLVPHPPRPVCRYGSQGKCNPNNNMCPPGTICRGDLCCRKLPPGNNRCKYGQDGKCGGFIGRVCPTGTTCKFIEDLADGEGKCCYVTKSVCHWGRDGFCGGLPGDVCRDGTVCTDMGDFPDARGECCISPPTCPGTRGVCGGKNDRECPDGTKCFIAERSKDGKGKCCPVKVTIEE